MIAICSQCGHPSVTPICPDCGQKLADDAAERQLPEPQIHMPEQVVIIQGKRPGLSVYLRDGAQDYDIRRVPPEMVAAFAKEAQDWFQGHPGTCRLIHGPDSTIFEWRSAAEKEMPF